MWYKSSPTSWKHEQIWTCKCQLRQTYIYSASFTVSQWLQPNKLRPTLVINRLRITKWQCSPIRSRSQPSKRKCYKAKLCQKKCATRWSHTRKVLKSQISPGWSFQWLKCCKLRSHKAKKYPTLKKVLIINEVTQAKKQLKSNKCQKCKVFFYLSPISFWVVNYLWCIRMYPLQKPCSTRWGQLRQSVG